MLDPILNSDTKLFIDPMLLTKSANPIISIEGVAAVERGFKNFLDLLAMSTSEGDVAWRGAEKILSLGERPETYLGYGGSGTSGSSRSQEVRLQVMRTAKEILTLGASNPNVVPLLSLFEKGVGADTISDMTTNFLLEPLAKITQQFSATVGLQTQTFSAPFIDFKLPENTFAKGTRPLPVLLVPRDILRDLPISADFADAQKVIFLNEEIRDSVNKLVGNIAKATITQKKQALRTVALSSLDQLLKILEAVSNASESYDESLDIDGILMFRDILHSDPEDYQGLVKKRNIDSPQKVLEVVLEIVEAFKSLVEKNNLWELLWYKHTPRHERASQLLFFAIANIICVKNDIDISPETNSGGGPVDFKFSNGFYARVLVEMKLSTGTVKSGYTKQLARYQDAADTDTAVFVVMDVGSIGRKMVDIRKIRDIAVQKNETPPEIILIDANRQRSASKLR